MIKLDSILVQHLTASLVLAVLVVHNQAATIIQNPKLANMNDGFLELTPNGSLILRSPLNHSSNVRQEALIFKAILNAIRLMPLQTKNTLNDLNQKIYGDGVEHKFPPFLERVIQRIQTYFSIYKYTDTSQPVRDDFKLTSTAITAGTTTTTMKSISPPATTPLTTNGIINASLTLDQQNDIDDNLSSSSSSSYYGFNREPLKTSTSSNTTSTTITTTTSTTITTTEKSTGGEDAQEDEEH